MVDKTQQTGLEPRLCVDSSMGGVPPGKVLTGWQKRTITSTGWMNHLVGDRNKQYMSRTTSALSNNTRGWVVDKVSVPSVSPLDLSTMHANLHL